jgi:hypothetical protein
MIIFQHFNKQFSEIASLVVPQNNKYCELYNKQYIKFNGEFDEFYTNTSHGSCKEYWTKLILLKYVLQNYNDEWVVMLDGDALLDHKNDISIVTQMMDDNKHIGLCRASDDVRQFGNINIGCMIVRNTNITKKIIDILITFGKSQDFDIYEQPALQYMIQYDFSVCEVTEIFPPKVFNHTSGPFVFHPCGSGLTSTDGVLDPKVAIQNKINALKQRILEK